MSIATKTGDDGTTGLMYNRRVPKTHPRIECCGAVDELNAALGLARALGQDAFVQEHVVRVQKDLITVMGELATLTEDLARYERDGYRRVSPDLIQPLDALVKTLEGQNLSFRGWATPGANPGAAALDLARAACRRAERLVCRLNEAGEAINPEIQVFLNRLSDVLWLLARRAEAGSP